jgi:hypothetical protein
MTHPVVVPPIVQSRAEVIGTVRINSHLPADDRYLPRLCRCFMLDVGEAVISLPYTLELIGVIGVCLEDQLDC